MEPSFTFTMAVAPAEIKLFGKWSYDDVEVRFRAYELRSSPPPPTAPCPNRRLRRNAGEP